MYNCKDWCLPNEQWKDISGYENLYQVSNMGRIRTVDRKETVKSNGGVRHWKGRILKVKGETYKTGYRVSLWKEGVEKDFLVARLVSMNFIELPFEKLTVNHIDGNRFNNKIENLEWVTLKENIQHGFKTGLYPTKKVIISNIKTGEAKHFKSLSEASRCLGRCNGYISNQIQKDGNIFDRWDNQYEVVAISAQTRGTKF